MKSYLKFLSRNKAYACIDVLGLALSFMFLIIIGAYTWQENHLDSQHSKLDRMYLLGINMDGEKVSGSHWQMVKKLTSQFPEIETATALYRTTRTIEIPDRSNVMSTMVYADSTFFDIFDFPIEQGDPSSALDAPNSIVITADFGRKIWGDENPIGKSLKIVGEEDPAIVTAVMKPIINTALAPNDGSHIDAVRPFIMARHFNSSLTDEHMSNAVGADVVLVAKEGNDLLANRSRYHDFAKEFFWILQLADMDYKLELIPFNSFYFSEYEDSAGNINHGNRQLVTLIFLFGLVILLFALMNYVNLTVAISGYRAKEMATRRLMGQTRAGIVARLIAESTALCVLSFIIGAALAWLAFPYAENLLDTKISVSSCLSPATIAIAISVILLMGILAGAVPAWLISSAMPIDIVRGAFRRHTKMVFSKVFIVVQNVITIAMIATSITMYLQVNHLVNAPMGYNTDGVMYIENWGTTREQGKTFMEKVLKIPGVEMASACAGTPLNGGNNNTLTYNDRTISFQILMADKNYMEILGLGLDRDNHTSSANKTYLNHQAISELGLADDADNFLLGNSTQQIDGIVSDFKIRTILDMQHPVVLFILNYENDEFWPWGFLIKVSGDEEEIYRQVQAIFKEVYQYEYNNATPYLKQEMEQRFANERNLQKIVSIFAVIAIVISLLGLVAMSTYFVQQREREIAVKKVFGCDSGEMLRKLVLTFLAYVAIAFVIAIPAIYYLMHSWLSGFSYRIGLYWWIFAIAGIVCAAVSLLAVFVQSRRAANANPVKALYQNI